MAIARLVLQGYDFSLVRSKLHTGYTSRKVKNNTPSRPSTIYLPPFLLGVARSSRRLFDSPSHVAVGLRVRSPGGIKKITQVPRVEPTPAPDLAPRAQQPRPYARSPHGRRGGRPSYVFLAHVPLRSAPLELFLRSTLVELWLGLAALGRDALVNEDAPRLGAVAAAAARLKRRKCCV